MARTLRNKYDKYLTYDKLMQAHLLCRKNKTLKKDIIKYISIIEEEIPKLEFNVNFKLWLDSFFSKLVGGSCDD